MHLDTFIVAALLVLLVTSIAVALSKQLGLGSILGLLVAGTIVGPYSPGPYVTEHVEDVRHFAELGVVLLLFLVGLEINPARLWRMRRAVFGLGSLQIILTGLLIGFFFSQRSLETPAALLVGFSLALSSTALVVQLLQERGEIARPHGSASFAILLMQDLAVVPLLAAVPIISDTGRLSAEIPLWQQFAVVIGSFGLIWVFGRHLVPWGLNRLARQRNQEAFLLVVLSTIFLAAWAMHQSGMSMVMGAFVMGMLLSGSRYRLQIQASIEPYKGVLMSLFFVAVGMSIDFRGLAENWMDLIQVVLIIIAIKLAVVWPLTRWFGHSLADASRIAFHLAQGGEFGFVLFGSAHALNVIDDATFVLLVGVISLSMLATPLLARLGEVIAQRLEPATPAPPTTGGLPKDALLPHQVVIGGYGRVGHTVAVLLHANGIPFVAFDTNPERVAQGIKDGFPVYFGDICDLKLQAAARLDEARLVVLTIDHGASAFNAISHIRMLYPQVPVISRARDLAMSARLMQAGANHAYPETLESSLRLAAVALELLGVDHENVESLLHDIRLTNYQSIKPPAAAPRPDTGTPNKAENSTS